jgi:diguanylate cyclase (GGDEF)-like protein
VKPDSERAPDEGDSAAEQRDRAATERDEAAARRDRDAELRGPSADRPPIGTARSDREASARDRVAAAHDRTAAADDRERAGRDRERAMVDDLTGALRRGAGLSGIEREIDRARRTSTPLVVAFVDVVGLKAVNDTYGHAAGDLLLRDVANALKLGLRSYDLVARYGGDEFVCALPGIDIDAARERFAEVKRELTERKPPAAVRVGLAALEASDQLEDLLRRADDALPGDSAR